MKKFFELALTSRKTVKAETYIVADAMSSDGEKLGQLDIKVLNNEHNGGIFVKYYPVEAADPKRSISSIIFSGKDDSKIQDVLDAIKDGYIDYARKKMVNSGFDDFISSITFISIVNECIHPEDHKLSIPSDFGITINNEFVCSYLGNEWLGIEVKIDSEFQSKIREAADAKRKKEAEEREKAVMEAFAKAFGSTYPSDEDE